MRLAWFQSGILVLAFSLPVAAAQHPSGLQSGAAVKSDPAKTSTRDAKKSRKAGKARQKPAQPVEQPSPPPVPLTPEQLPAAAPQVSYLNGQLTIQSQNSTLAEILKSVHRQTGAQIDVPPGAETQRIAAVIGPGPAAAVITRLLNGTPFGYVILGSPTNPGAIQRVIITRNTGGGAQQPAAPPPANVYAAPGQPATAEGTVEEEPEQPVEEEPSPEQQVQPTPEEAPQSEPPQPPQPNEANPEQNPNQPQIKTPDQLLQELQRMQRQQQQQQQQQQTPPQ